MNLHKVIPFAAVTFVIAGIASMGLPGFSGFVAELMVLIGVWRAYPLLALCVGFGLIAGVVYIWRAMQKAFFMAGNHTRAPNPPLPPVTFRNASAPAILIASSVLVGFYPQMLLNIVVPALNSPLFNGLHKGSWQ